MTVQLVEETVVTNLDAALEVNDTSTAVPVSRWGAFLASIVFATALASAGATVTVQVASHTGRKRFEVAESGTAVVESDPELVNQVEELFEQGASEFFEDGVHSAFSRSLLLMLAEHGGRLSWPSRNICFRPTLSRTSCRKHFAGWRTSAIRRRSWNVGASSSARCMIVRPVCATGRS
jgi:hypothetical protein